MKKNYLSQEYPLGPVGRVRVAMGLGAPRSEGLRGGLGQEKADFSKL
jgi:hypothetical protein